MLVVNKNNGISYNKITKPFHKHKEVTFHDLWIRTSLSKKFAFLMWNIGTTYDVDKSTHLMQTFNNPLKACFSNKKCHITVQTRKTQIVLSVLVIENRIFNRFLKIFNVQNELPITFCSDKVCNKALKARKGDRLRHRNPICNPR